MIEFNRHLFENDLTLLHHHDDTTPFVVVNVLYKVGARNETATRTGFAHLFEHLMFEGTTNLANFDHPIQEAGGTNNAFTNNDFTNYYIKLPKENLELGLWLEADRMKHLDINENSLMTQKKVVIEEFKENYTNKPYGDVWHLLRALVYQDHPYQWPTIGKDYSHIDEASLTEVIDFYNTYYQPKNAIVCISGNATWLEAKTLVGDLMGQLENNDKSGHPIPKERKQVTARLTEVKRNVSQDAIYIAFKISDRYSEDYYTADVISDILASGRSSRLKDKLIKQLQLFTKVDAYMSGSLDTGIFVFEGFLKEGVSIEKAEAAIWNEIEFFKTTVVNARELEKVKNKMLTYMAFSEKDLMNRAIGLSYHEMVGDANYINQEEGKYLAIDAETIQLFANRYFNKEQSSTLHYLKDEATLN